jgi:hypothetical protein
VIFQGWNRRRASPLLVISVLAACGSSSDNKSPSEKCFDLVDELCKRAVECTPGAAGMQAACEEAVAPAYMCEAKTVSPTYDTCMAQLDGASCDVVFQTDAQGQRALVPPDSCMGVLLGVGPANPAAFTHIPVAGDFSSLSSVVAAEPR